MKKIAAIYLLLMIITASATAADTWELIWSDEFDTPGLPDAKKWTHEVGFIRNNESQYYTESRKENARVTDGMLIIESRKERFRNPDYNPSGNSRRWKYSKEFADYTSASLTTRGKGQWCCGRIEVRAKLPTGRGTWPAIWMLGTNISEVGWPKCGEIDIMENVGFDPNRIHANIHTQKYNHMRGTNKGASIIVDKPFEKFHVYAVEWSPQQMKFFLDDKLYFTYENEKSGEAAWPYDRDHYLILNTAIGGSWGAQKGIDDSIFPQRFYIDYVRVYKKAPENQR
ncbi:MAG: glycoside hydrolase family 16 protein [Sedimentisphaerales bacterium]|nr:glycoside hydrolase family 16 protein [Sedimentisphaerales bacterium]